MKVKICGEDHCHYDPDEVEETLTCDECPYQIEVDKEEFEEWVTNSYNKKGEC